MRPDYISIPDYNILKEKYGSNLEEVLKKIEAGYPVQYLIGNVEFINTTIKVNEEVLIPRFETEMLVDLVLKYASKQNKKLNIIDLGTGSGCIAIAIKKNLKCNMIAVDISSAAIKLARENAKVNNTDINFIIGDMADELNDQYDIIVSNPPYIKKGSFVSSSVEKYEPHLALYAPEEGLYYYRIILEKHLKNLNKPGLIAFEIGDNEKEVLTKLISSYPNLSYEFKNDLQGLPRYLLIYNE